MTATGRGECYDRRSRTLAMRAPHLDAVNLIAKMAAGDFGLGIDVALAGC